MRQIYNLFILPLLYAGFRIGALFNLKIRKGIQGRKDLLKRLANDLDANQKPTIWFHNSSYGEFEQAKPILARLKADYQNLFFVVSFFSPSGYEHIKSSPLVDYICYLPFDSIYNAKRFLAIVKPRVVVIVRHDIWPNFVWTIQKKNIPLVLIDASLPQNSSRFWPVVRRFNKDIFNSFTKILTTSQDEIKNLGKIVTDKTKLAVTGDTKYDQVYQRTLEMGKVESLLKFPYLQNKPVWIIGSSWPADEKMVIPAFANLIRQFNKMLMIIVPHEPSENRLKEIELNLSSNGLSSIRFSQLTHDNTGFNAVIVDQIGLLANLYRLGKIAFVGGSFESKVHNVLEPAAYGIPVLFGPKITTQHEALLLAERKGSFVVHSITELTEKMTELLTDEQFAGQIGDNAKQLVLEHLGATEKTVNFLKKYLL